ncbi:hypothetical protein AAGW05_04500 [Arthrobacter sp. LAPM80]
MHQNAIAPTIARGGSRPAPAPATNGQRFPHMLANYLDRAVWQG